MMGINWKVRFNNPHFLISVLVAMFSPILAYFGLTGADITNWSILADTLLNAISNPYVCILVLVSVWNAVQDPTTQGICDSQRAMNYEKPSK